MPYFKAKTSDRQKEFIFCLKKNIECIAIEKIFLLIDDNHIPELDDEKIEIINLPGRPSYLDWINLTNEKCNNNTLSILANTDIYFDRSILKLNKIFSLKEESFVALSRYEKMGDNEILHKNPHWSQDVWVISSDVVISEAFKKNLDIPLGVPRCDNKIAYLFSVRGFEIYNPCYEIKTVHVHETQLRTYDKCNDKQILGGTAWVYPESNLGIAADLKFDIWVLSASNISGVKINNTFEEFWGKKNTIIDKPVIKSNVSGSVIGFDANWQYPAITEKHAYKMAIQYLSSYKNSNIAYFGFPWATLIDHILHNKKDISKADVLRENLFKFKTDLKKYDKVVTVCQHIHMLKIEELFDKLGITDVFWTHAIKEQKLFPSFSNISIHPFPLYPVQAIDFKQNNIKKKYVFSFVGAKAPNYYLTDTRNIIIDHLKGHPNGLVVGRDTWHYNRAVYDHQIHGKEKDTKNIVDKTTSEQFQKVMKESVFALCPSGTGPNSIRLWEAIAFNVIPVILADTYLPPGDKALWDEATITIPENLDAIKSLPQYLESIHKDSNMLDRKRQGLKQLRMKYSKDTFIYDIIGFFTKFLGNADSVGKKKDIDSIIYKDRILIKLVNKINNNSSTDLEDNLYILKITTLLFSNLEAVKKWFYQDEESYRAFIKVTDNNSDFCSVVNKLSTLKKIK